MSFVKATRTAVPARIALTGPTNGGKTLSALYLAEGIIRANHPDFTLEQIYDKIAFIDSERGRAKFYVNRVDLPYPTGAFNYLEIEAPYHVNKYIEAVKSADKLVGPTGVIIIDSLSHPWNYEGGILDRKSQVDLKGGNSYANWAPFSSEQSNFITQVLSTKANTIGTMRSKMDYVLEQNNQGKMAPKKVGLKPVQRDDTEFEFDITLMLDNQHTATIVKDTTILSQFADEADNLGMITPEMGTVITQWLNKGVDPTKLIEEQRAAVIAEIQKIAKEHPVTAQWYKTSHPGKKVSELDLKEAKKVLDSMREIKGG